jgi:hypothetical protein
MEEQSYTSTHPLGHTGPVTESLYLFTFTLDVYRNFGSDWQYSRGLIIQHSLLCDVIYSKNIITYTNIHSTTDILYQQSTKHVTKWIILLTPFLCLHFIRLHICTCSVYCLHFIMYSLLVGTTWYSGKGAVLQIGRSLVRSQLVSLEFFIDIKSFRSHHGPGVDSASNRNEYRSISWG